MSNSLRDKSPFEPGRLWSWVRSVLSQGADIRCDYDTGNVHKTYEAYSARLDCAAQERSSELLAAIDGHPPADGVVVPRDLFTELRKLAYDAAIDATFPEDQKFASELVAKADAIMAQRE